MAEEKNLGSLGFFTSYDDLSDSSDDSNEEEEEESVKNGEKKQHETATQENVTKDSKASSSSTALPTPDVLFNSVSKPTFLYNPLNKQIDWDSLAVKAPEEAPRDFKPWEINAVPPPQSYFGEPARKRGPPPGMDMAIKWSNVYEDNGEDAPRSHTDKAKFLPADEQPPDSDEESEKTSASMSNKKRRVETFQQKEKRKRDFGQATSEKNFVEEEKRILRQKIE